MTRFTWAVSSVLLLNWFYLTPNQAAESPFHDFAITEAHAPRAALKLALKHYANPGAQPVLMIHGLAQNDRCWDSTLPQFSFAKYLHSQGFDVWIGNMRGAGTEGFRSETPPGPHHWTLDDYAIDDVPALIDRVREATGQAPFVIGHSLAAWAIEGYFAGVNYDSQQRVVARQSLAHSRTTKVKGLVTVAGVYNLRWTHSIQNLRENPIHSEVDYYQSNYELELLSRVKPLNTWIYGLNELPLGWIRSILDLRLDEIPILGKTLARLYPELQKTVIQSPILNMFYYAPNSDAKMVRLHGRDGLEGISPRLLEQLANAIRTRRTESYYHEKDGESRPPAFDYSEIRRNPREVPMLFIGGTRDRLASADQVFEDGYLATNALKKHFIPVEAGHLDILTGKNAREQVMKPVAEWMKRHAY